MFTKNQSSQTALHLSCFSGKPVAVKLNRLHPLLPNPNLIIDLTALQKRFYHFPGTGLKVESGVLWLTLEKQKILKLQVHTQVHVSPLRMQQI